MLVQATATAQVCGGLNAAALQGRDALSAARVAVGGWLGLEVERDRLRRKVGRGRQGEAQWAYGWDEARGALLGLRASGRKLRVLIGPGLGDRSGGCFGMRGTFGFSSLALVPFSCSSGLAFAASCSFTCAHGTYARLGAGRARQAARLGAGTR